MKNYEKWLGHYNLSDKMFTQVETKVAWDTLKDQAMDPNFFEKNYFDKSEIEMLKLLIDA